jgi:hypothetical protein
MTIAGSPLKAGNTKSCGCLRREVSRAKATKHGVLDRGGKTKTYSIWQAMKKRCSNPNSTDYKYYGGRGIKVCERWRTSFESFLADMGECPGPDMTLDRIDGTKGYEPGNCRWASRLLQAENKAATILVEFEGKSMSLSQFAKYLGKSQGTIWRNVVRQGMTPDQVAEKYGRAA